MNNKVENQELKNLYSIFADVSGETGIPEAKIRKAFYDMVRFVQEEVIQPTKCRRVRLFRLGTLVPISSKLTEYVQRHHPERDLPNISDVIEKRKNKYGFNNTGK